MSNGRFQGWYYKQRTGDYMLAFIPGRASGGPFVQMIDSNGTRHFAMPDFHVRGDTVRTGGCIFSPAGLHIQLPMTAKRRCARTSWGRSHICQCNAATAW